MIQSLPAEVRARLRSGVTICSFGQCVEELLLNSTDACASCVAIRVDIEAFRIQVVDNGTGMSREDVELVGKRYFTSKCHSVGDLENLNSSGFRGEAVASIANMSSLVEILSKSNKSAKTFAKMFQNGKALEVCEAEVSRPSVGTTVTICNLFYNLPVRRQCLDHVLELERTRQKVEAISFMYPSISFSLRNDAAGSMLLQLPKTKDVCSRFCQIYGLSKSQKLRPVQFEYRGFALSGYISCEGHYNKSMQFLYVNKRLVLKTRLHKLIDFLLRKESVICKAKTGPPGKQNSPSRHRAGPELHGIYVININCSYCEYDICLEPAKTLIEFRDWDGVLKCVEEGTKMFLNREHLFMEPSNDDIAEFNEKNDFTLSNTDIQPIVPCRNPVQETFRERCDTVINSFEFANLKSKDVLRKKLATSKLLNNVTLDVNTEVIQIPDKKTHVCVETEQRGLCEPLSQGKEGVQSEKLSMFVSEGEETVLDKREVQHNIKLCPLSIDSPVDQVPCAEAMSDISEQSNCKGTENCVQLTLSTSRDAVLFNTLGKPEDVYVGGYPEVSEGAELGCECGFEMGAGPSTPLELASSEKCDMLKKNTGPHEGSTLKGSSLGARPIRDRLCLTGFITHLASNPVKEINQTHKSAEDILGLSMSIRKPCSSVTNTAVGLTNKNSNLDSKREDHDNRIGTIHAQESCSYNSWSGSNVRLPVQKSHSVTSTFCSSHKGNTENIFQSTVTQSIFAKPRASRKLALSAHLGSLERFRRWCGNMQNSSPQSSLTHDNKNGSCIAPKFSCAEPEHILPLHTNGLSIQCLDTTLTLDAKSNIAAAPLIEGNSDLIVETPPSTTEVVMLRHEHVMESPMTLHDYTQSKQSVIVKTIPLRSLASKLSKMRGVHTETPVIEKKDTFKDAPLMDSNDNVICKHVLEQELDTQASQKLQLFHGDSGSDNSRLNQEIDYYKKRYHGAENTGAEGLSKQPMFVNATDNDLSSGSISLDVGSSKLCPNSENEDTCGKIAFLNASSKATEGHVDLFSNHLDDDTTDMVSLRVNENPNPCSSGWLQHFDASLGRTVYINTATGLSSYTAPVEESRATCTKDLTTLAVNIVSRSGFQHWCHPFRSELLLPFLPRPREERNSAARQPADAPDATGDGESLELLFSEWENPVFARCPQVAVDVSSREATSLSVKIHNILYPYRFTKEMIHSMKVLRQVDNKFIACLINTKSEDNANPDGNLLVLVDQHAAHERVRLEQLIAGSYEAVPEAFGRKRLLSSTVCPPMQIEVTEEHRRLLRSYQSILRDLGLGLSFPEGSSPNVLVDKVPLCFVEREANEVRRGRPPVAKAIVEEFIREEVEMLQTAGRARGILPLTVMKVLASQACHGAIKFNKPLNVEECCCLMESLSWCKLPFQCAHGRPAILPLADMDHLELHKQELPKPNLSNLRKKFRAWQLFGMQEKSTLPTPLEGAARETYTQATK
ncbi:DNA mismatch repair protein Mlh3 isoform X2 [Lissotriton helveticus]